VVIEDLHWCDETSLEVALALAREAPTLPLLLVLTYRSDEIPAELGALLATLDRERLAVDMTLPRLSPSDVGAMIRAILGLPRPPPAFVETLYTITEGNPFFVEEMLKSLTTAGDLTLTGDGWERILLQSLHLPRSVQITVQQRLMRLSAPAREVLTLAAVAGRRFDFDLLQALTGRDDVALIRLIKELIGAQLVIEESADTFAFRHALTRQAVYAGLLARERRTLHRSIAEAMERIYATSLDLHLTDLVYHWYEAEAWENVVTYAPTAGEQAQRLYAPRSAVVQLTRALDAAQRLSMPPPLNVLRSRGQAYAALDEFEPALSDYQASLEAARTHQDRRAEWQVLMDLGLLWAARDYARTGDYLHQALALARDIGDLSTLAHTLNRAGNWYMHTEWPREGLRYHQEALALFLSCDDWHGQATTLDLLGITSYISGDLISGVEYYERAIALFRQLNEQQGLVSSLACLALRGASYLCNTVVWPIASATVCTREGEEALAIAHHIGWRAGESFALSYLGQCLGARGEYTRALEMGRSALAIATEIEHRQWMNAAHFLLGALHLELLALPEAQDHFERALELAQTMRSSLVVRATAGLLASTYVAQQNLAAAESLLTATLDVDTPTQTIAQRMAWFARVELALARHEPAVALQIIERLIASTLNHERWGAGAIPRLWHLRGEALAALGQTSEAEADLLATQAVAQAQDIWPLRWRILLSLGKLYWAQARREQARAVFDAARGGIEALATKLEDDGMRNLFLQRATADIPHIAPPSRRLAKEAFGGLTEREREVAGLIARHKSNRAIAVLLVLSERTVEKHVENILSKLGFASREQVAAWAAEKGLDVPID
jgi:DNA-binding CsgD family transcriptional regulator